MFRSTASLTANVSADIRSSIAEIWGHKLRSSLTLVGIVLGTTSLVVMVSMFTPACPKALNIFWATPVWRDIPRPTTEILATSSS
jgi:hypothetical protein